MSDVIRTAILILLLPALLTACAAMENPADPGDEDDEAAPPEKANGDRYHPDAPKEASENGGHDEAPGTVTFTPENARALEERLVAAGGDATTFRKTLSRVKAGGDGVAAEGDLRQLQDAMASTRLMSRITFETDEPGAIVMYRRRWGTEEGQANAVTQDAFADLTVGFYLFWTVRGTDRTSEEHPKLVLYPEEGPLHITEELP